MSWVARIGLIVWMYSALVLGAIAFVALVFGWYGLLWAWTGSEPPADSWLLRAVQVVGQCVVVCTVLIAALAAKRQFPTASVGALSLAGTLGLIGGVVGGDRITEAWGADMNLLLSSRGLPQDANLDDFPIPIALAIYGLSIGAGSFVPGARRKPSEPSNNEMQLTAPAQAMERRS